jgi:hypothetical protein
MWQIRWTVASLSDQGKSNYTHMLIHLSICITMGKRIMVIVSCLAEVTLLFILARVECEYNPSAALKQSM